ncbi:hypothetical protein [Roseateles aquatilis]|uniref:hypothetical protein n=1 Tax=Roseateles aquatilis TaxID=431061 RepID=UPI0011307750|nr:hypothetical protein [Roseateles aquatilis]
MAQITFRHEHRSSRRWVAVTADFYARGRSIRWTAVVDCVEAQLTIAGGDLLGLGESPEQAVIRLAGDTVNLLRL